MMTPVQSGTFSSKAWFDEDNPFPVRIQSTSTWASSQDGHND